MPKQPDVPTLLKKIRSLEQEARGRKEAEKELWEGREHLRSLMESASNFAVYRLVHDKDNPFHLQVVFVSPSLKEIMGIPDPLRFETWFEEMHPDDRQRMVAANLRAFETLRFDEIYRVFHLPRQEWRWLHAISTGVLDEKNQTRYVNGIIIDITDQKKAEDALQEAYETLDQKVREKTDQLQRINERLIQENRERKRIERSLKSSEEKLRLLSGQLINAQERERKRLAFELHDELGQVLVGLRFQIHSLKNKLAGDSAPVREAIEHTLHYLDQATERVHRLSRDLSPTMLEHLGLPETLRLLINEFSNYFKVELTGDLERLGTSFSPEQKLNIFRIFQEALTNIRKHSRADRVSIRVVPKKNRLLIAITDNGLGIRRPLPSARNRDYRGMGLNIMEERARMAGGTLVVEGRKNRGASIRLELPGD